MAGRRRWTLDRIICHAIFWECLGGIVALRFHLLR